LGKYPYKTVHLLSRLLRGLTISIPSDKTELSISLADLIIFQVTSTACLFLPIRSNPSKPRTTIK
jgi:hypothetical protein